SSPYITIYKRSEDTFTKLSDPSTLPAGNGVSSAFSPDGNYLAIGHLTTPFITIYKTVESVSKKWLIEQFNVLYPDNMHYLFY
ncbi:MAG: hypothetical protein JW807_14810, partial [Spirochaetes bacterium]|nr:hypothetical protein [Spirochaetota bacterium]